MRLAHFLLPFVLPAGLAAQQVMTVRGTVRDEQAVPITGAEVRIGDRTASTDSLGRFRIDSLRPGTQHVAIRSAGYAPLRTQVALAEPGPAELDFRLTRAFLLPPVITEQRRSGIYGTVGDTLQQPLPGVRVQAAGVNGGVVFTDSLGRFAFPAADRGAYLLRFTHPGYAERRISFEIPPGEGRQIGAVLIPSRRLASRSDDLAFELLRSRIALGLRRNRMQPTELERYGSAGLCEIPRIASEAGRGQATTTVILNGVEVLPEFPISSLCAWRADEVGLVEFGADICADVTQTVGQSLPVPAWCAGRSRGVTRSMGGSRGRIRAQGSGGGSYVIIWENR